MCYPYWCGYSLIRLTQITSTRGKTIFTFAYDASTVEIERDVLDDKLRQVKDLLGRDITLNDVRNVVITLINDVRAGKDIPIAKFDFEKYIGVDLEA